MYAPYMSIAVSVLTSENLSTIGRSPKKHRLKNANAPTTPVVKEEGPLDGTKAT